MNKLTLALMMLTGLLACSKQQTENDTEQLSERPNIVWINTEDISPAFGAYGDRHAITPVFDSLAKHSVVFDRAYAPAPVCSPARSTLVSGLYATATGTPHLRSETPYPSELKTLPTLFSDAGYFTSIQGKSDYNFSPDGLWQHWSESRAPWRERAAGQPFLSVFTLKNTHEGRGNSRKSYEQSMASLPDSLRHPKLSVPVPPYYPDTEEFRDLWTRYYDLVTAFDHELGQIMANLKEDGLLENTIVFVFSDHGFGMPRYKRWLNETGLRVPFLVYLPEKYAHLASAKPGEHTTQLVSFVDFAPTALALAGLEVPAYMQGNPFLGPAERRVQRQDVFAFRDRTDNVYDMSRAVRDERFLYVRNYMPHLPYIQPSYIFSDEKESYRALLKMHADGTLPAETEKMFAPKPVEELYDLDNDPHELNNLAADPAYAGVMERLRNRLREYVLQTGDLGFLYETEMVLRSEGRAPYYLLSQEGKFDRERIFAAAELVGRASVNQVRASLEDRDSGVQFWGLTAMRQLPVELQRPLLPLLEGLAAGNNPSLKIAAAELLYAHTFKPEYLRPIVGALDHPVSEMVLQAARALELAKPQDPELLTQVDKVLKRYRAPEGASYPYTDYNFASFISWSLESVLKGGRTNPIVSKK